MPIYDLYMPIFRTHILGSKIVATLEIKWLQRFARAKFLVVEMMGIEPMSESTSTRLSPSASDDWFFA